MSRNLRSTIPSLPTNLKPKIISVQDFQDNREKIQQQQKGYHDKHATSLPTLEEGEHVRMRDGKKWKHITVRKNASEQYSNIVITFNIAIRTSELIFRKGKTYKNIRYI